jgi:hypothetical protein
MRLASAHAVLGDSLFFLGEFAAARAHLERGMALSDSKQDSSDALRDGDPIGVRCRRYGAWILWLVDGDALLPAPGRGPLVQMA